MQYTVIFELRGSLNEAAAVEWTDAVAPVGSGTGWEPCLEFGGGRWRFTSHDPAGAWHWRDPGLFGNIGMRYRLTPGGPWSPVSASRKEINIVAVIPEDAPAPTAADWTALEPFELGDGNAAAAFTLLGVPAGAAAVDWTRAPTPAEADWTPCRALGAGRWRLDGPGSAVTPGGSLAGIGIRYRLAAASPASAVSEDRRTFTVASGLVSPILLTAPALAGAGKIGQPVTLDPGLWGGAPLPGLGVAWLRDGAAIPGAAGLSYTPGSADDQTDLGARVTATSAAGSLAAVTATLHITHVAPVAVGELFDEIFDQGTGPQDLPAAGAFAGAGLRFAVTGAGARIDAATGVLSIPTAAAVDGAAVTVTATNSGGAASLSFLVTVEAAELPFPGAIATSLWSVTEVRDAAEAAGVAGRRRATLSAAAIVPSGFLLHAYTGSVAGGVPSLSLPTITPGATLTTTTGLAVGATCCPVLFWRRLSDDAFQVADTKPSFAIQGIIEPPVTGGIPRQPQAQINDALGRPLTDFGDFGGGGTNSGYFGSAMVLLAASSFAGNAATDARLLQQLRYNVSGHDPSGAGGFAAQHELRFVVAAAIAKLVPRVWSQLTAAERTRIDVAVRGCLVGAAFTSSDRNPDWLDSESGPQHNLRGGTAWRRGNPNFRCAAPAIVQAARVFLGSDAAFNGFLDNFSKAAFHTLCVNNGLSNMADTMRARSAPSPSNAEVDGALPNWRYNGRSIAQIQDMLVEEANFAFSNTVNAGLNGGAGIPVNGVARGRIMAGAAGLPNPGARGMAHEFDSSDAGGARSSASYVMFGSRVILDWMTLLMCAGLLNRGSPVIQALKNRIHVGMTDLKYKSDNGYRSYSKGGVGSNNEDWTAATHATQWAWSYSFGQWYDLLKPWLDGG